MDPQGLELGWLDVCLRCADLAASLDFYMKLGFEKVEGDVAEGWVVVVNQSGRIGLFCDNFMGEEPFSLNFRGGNIREIAKSLVDRAIEPDAEPKFVGESGGSIRLRDPDGNLVFIDGHDGEIRKVPPSDLNL
jgi:catechol 2,3-dioxygenase-like lactoylglutathione lyase family enzyme